MVIILNISFISLISSMFQWFLYKKSIKFVYSTNFKLKHHENRKIIKTMAIIALLIITYPTISLSREISGTVRKYGSHEKLSNIKVIFKGTTNGVTTDYNGSFMIKTTSISDTILVFSYIGYITQELNVAKTKYHVIYMREDDSTKTNYNFLNSLNILYQFLRQEDKEKPIKIPMRPETN